MKKILFGLTTLGILSFVSLFGANQASAKICNGKICFFKAHLDSVETINHTTFYTYRVAGRYGQTSITSPDKNCYYVNGIHLNWVCY